MFKRRSGLGGLRIITGPMRREDPATGGAGGADPAAGGGGGAPAATPPAAGTAAPPAPAGTPAPADVTQTPEFKAAVAQAKADADAKARTGSKDAARNEVLDQIATALGIKPKEVDPAAIGAELAKAREENASLKIQIAVGAAARSNGGDEDMVHAWLAHKGKLKGLDPAAADYSTKVEELVKAEIEANPKLKAAGPAVAVTPGASGASSTSMGGGAGGSGRVLGLGNALNAAMRK